MKSVFKQIFNHQNIMGRLILSVSFILSLFSISIFFIPNLTILLQYDRHAILNGEIYRLFTCHFTHFSTQHLFWDVCTFILLGSFCEKKNIKLFCKSIIISITFISFGILLFMPNIMYYRGLSGIDSALFSTLAFMILFDKYKNKEFSQSLIIIVLIIGFFAKMIYELQTNSCFFVSNINQDFIPLPQSHIIGFICGIIVIMKNGRRCINLGDGGRSSRY